MRGFYCFFLYPKTYYTSWIFFGGCRHCHELQNSAFTNRFLYYKCVKNGLKIFFALTGIALLWSYYGTPSYFSTLQLYKRYRLTQRSKKKDHTIVDLQEFRFLKSGNIQSSYGPFEIIEKCQKTIFKKLAFLTICSKFSYTIAESFYVLITTFLKVLTFFILVDFCYYSAKIREIGKFEKKINVLELPSMMYNFMILSLKQKKNFQKQTRLLPNTLQLQVLSYIPIADNEGVLNDVENVFHNILLRLSIH